MVKSCYVCKTSGNNTKKSYFRIPKVISHRNEEISQLSILRRKKWCDVLNLSFNESSVRICSDHFKSGLPADLLDKDDVDWIPSLNLEKIKSKRKKIVKKIIHRKPKVTDDEIFKRKNVMCRFCGKTVDKSLCVNIFECENFELLLNSISIVLAHPVTVLDKLPHFGCKPCIRKIEICSDWITQFRNTEKHLTEHHADPETNDILCDLDSIFLNSLDEDLTLDETRAQWREEKIKEIFEEIQQNENLLDQSDQNKQMHEIIKNHSDTSDQDEEDQEPELEKPPVKKKRKKSLPTSTIEEKTLKCHNCFKKFENIEDLQIHKNFCKLFYCQLCKPQISFKDKEKYMEHKKNSHRELLMCHLCGNSYSQTYLVKHFKNHFENSKECNLCGKVLKNSTLLMAHMGKIHEVRHSQVCDGCGGTFKNLKKHLSDCKAVAKEEIS